MSQDTTSNTSERTEITPKTTTTYPNAGVSIDLTVRCSECRETDEQGTEMNAIGLADAINNAVIYQCPNCEKATVIGRYGHSHINTRTPGDIIEQTHTGHM